MLPSVSPAVLKGNTPKAFNRISAVFDKNLLPKVVAVDTAKNHVIIARYFPDYSNLHFQVYNKDCKMTDTFVLAGGQDDGNICVQKYSAYRNNVMRKRDALVSPDKDMSFEQILQTRPVIVKRIESLLNSASEALGKRH